MTELFRKEAKEKGEGYLIDYQPADSRCSFAVLTLTFVNENPEKSEVARYMEQEMERWIQRYPVPIMAASFDKAGVVIHDIKGKDKNHLLGYRNDNGEIVKQWDVNLESSFEKEKMSEDQLSKIYSDIEYELKSEIQNRVREECKVKSRDTSAFKIVFSFFFLIPFAIVVLSVGVPWISLVSGTASILVGLYKLGRFWGYIKPSKKEKEVKRQKMEHYYLHCEQNPEGFEKLKNDNFRKEAIRDTTEEYNELEQAHVKRGENMTVERLMTAIGMRIFIKYYDYFKRGIDIINKLEEEGFTLKSCRSRQSKAQRIFRENLQVGALKMVVNASKVAPETKDKAIELLRKEQQIK